MKTKLQENLIREMENQGLSHNKLAQLSGLHQPTLTRIISGESKDPRRSNLDKIAEALGISTLALTGEGKGNKVNEPAIKYETRSLDVFPLDDMLDALKKSHIVKSQDVINILSQSLKDEIYKKLTIEEIYRYWIRELARAQGKAPGELQYLFGIVEGCQSAKAK